MTSLNRGEGGGHKILVNFPDPYEGVDLDILIGFLILWMSTLYVSK